MKKSTQNRCSQRWVWVHSVLGFLALFALAACGGGARSDFDVNRGEVTADDASMAIQRAFVAPADSVYRVAVADQLEVVFFTHPEQNRFVQVRPDGRISMPYVGDVYVQGREPQSIARDLETAYANVLVSPRVDVIVQKISAQYYVLGEVRSPGAQALTRSVDLLQGIASAGGYTATARLNNIVLLRKDESGGAFAAILDLRDYMGAEDRGSVLRLRPDDIVWIPKDAISRWDNVSTKLVKGLIQSEDLVIKGWQLGNLDKVYNRQNF